LCALLVEGFSFSVGTRENAAVRKTASAAEVHVSMLGEFSVTTGGQPVEDQWRLRKAKTLVKMLALAPGHRLHRDAIGEILWPDAELATAANNLYQILHTIRRVIGATSIALNDDVVRLCPAGGLSVDVDQFEQAAAIARRSTTSPHCNMRSSLDRVFATRRPIRRVDART
jgi:DNA-binding SARP family transcriptional activator